MIMSSVYPRRESGIIAVMVSSLAAKTILLRFISRRRFCLWLETRAVRLINYGLQKRKLTTRQVGFMYSACHMRQGRTIDGNIPAS